MGGADSKIPDDLRYTKDHEWVRIEGNLATMGITDYAQDALTDVVFAELPDEGEEFSKGDSMGVVESVKSVSDIFAPLSGRVAKANADLDASPELLNDDPYGKGWFCAIEMSDPSEADALLTPAQYREFLGSQ